MLVIFDKVGWIFRKIRLIFSLFAGDFSTWGGGLEMQGLEIFTPGTGGLVTWSQQYLPLVQEGQQYGVDNVSIYAPGPRGANNMGRIICRYFIMTFYDMIQRGPF